MNAHEELVKTLKEMETVVSLETIPKLVRVCLESLKEYEEMMADEKKELISGVLRELIDVVDTGNEYIEALDPVLKMMVPMLIDEFFEVDGKELHFSKEKVRKARELFACCVKKPKVVEREEPTVVESEDVVIQENEELETSPTETSE
jgi:hypothetical protein